MKTNLGSFDAGIRFVLGNVILLLAFHGLGWWGLLGLIPLATACLGFCPLYRIIHLDTARWEDDFEHRHGRG